VKMMAAMSKCTADLSRLSPNGLEALADISGPLKTAWEQYRRSAAYAEIERWGATEEALQATFLIGALAGWEARSSP